MQIIKLQLTHLRNEEWFSVFAKFRELAPLYGDENLGITDLLARLEPLHDKADKLLLILHKSVHTDEIVSADKERDQIFRGFFEAVKASRKLVAAADKDAAERLYILLSSYRKSILRSSYDEESSALYNLLEDLRKKKYAPDITQLGLGRWVDNLRTAEQKFQASYAARTKEEIGKPVERLEEVRKQTDALYRSITDVLYAKLMADGLGGDVIVDPDDLKTGAYDSTVPDEHKGNIVYNFVIAWNRILKHYTNLLATRVGRRAKDKEPLPDETDETDEPSDIVEA
jgi:hypothetical protein